MLVYGLSIVLASLVESGTRLYSVSRALLAQCGPWTAGTLVPATEKRTVMEPRMPHPIPTARISNRVAMSAAKQAITRLLPASSPTFLVPRRPFQPLRERLLYYCQWQGMFLYSFYGSACHFRNQPVCVVLYTLLGLGALASPFMPDVSTWFFYSKAILRGVCDRYSGGVLDMNVFVLFHWTHGWDVEGANGIFS